jgi:hypothetical protein
MRTLAPYASLALVAWLAACSGFTEIGEGPGKAGMSGSAGSGVSGASGKGGNGSGGTQGSGATGGSNGGSTGGTPSAGSGGNRAGAGGGSTAGSGASECKTTTDCPVTDVACSPCADGSYACPTVNCVGGQCVSTFPTCPAECSVDGDCPISKAPCQLCADGSTACPWAKCEAGKCTAGIETCENTDPCAGKSCGDPCTTCNPELPCIAVAMTCDENLKCQTNSPLCSSTGCKSDGECLTDVCGRCPGVEDACASQICVDGQCTFSCPTDACGGCEAPQICVYQAGGPGPGHYACAEQLPCGAVGACACIVDQGTCESEKVDGYCTCDNGLE